MLVNDVTLTCLHGALGTLGCRRIGVGVRVGEREEVNGDWWGGGGGAERVVI